MSDGRVDCDGLALPLMPIRPINHSEITNRRPNRRQWYLRGVACGADASWGALGRCMEELGVSATELEDPRWMALDSALEYRWVGGWVGLFNRRSAGECA